MKTVLPTPAEDDVPGQMFLQGEEGAVNKGVQEVALHQQPAVVCKDGVVGKHQHDLTRRLPHHNYTKELELGLLLFQVIKNSFCFSSRTKRLR